VEDASGRASNADPRGDSLSGDDFDDRPTIGQQEPTRLPPSTTIQAKKRARVEHIVSNIRVPTYTENAGRSVVLSPRSFDRMVEPEVGKEDHGLGLRRGDGERRSKRKQVLPQQHDTGDDRRSVDEDLSDDDDDDNDDDDDDDDDAGDDDDDGDGDDDDDDDDDAGDDAGDDDDDGDDDDGIVMMMMVMMMMVRMTMTTTTTIDSGPHRQENSQMTTMTKYFNSSCGLFSADWKTCMPSTSSPCTLTTPTSQHYTLRTTTLIRARTPRCALKPSGLQAFSRYNSIFLSVLKTFFLFERLKVVRKCFIVASVNARCLLFCFVLLRA